jgi:hypothetical protein
MGLPVPPQLMSALPQPRHRRGADRDFATGPQGAGFAGGRVRAGPVMAGEYRPIKLLRLRQPAMQRECHSDLDDWCKGGLGAFVSTEIRACRSPTTARSPLIQAWWTALGVPAKLLARLPRL